MHAGQPKHLIVAFLLRLFRSLYAARVVAEALRLPRAARYGARIVAFHVDLRGRQTVFVICADGRKHYQKGIFFGSVHAEFLARCDHQRTDIKSRARRGGNPIFFEFYQFINRVARKIRVQTRHAHSVARTVHAGDVFRKAEYADFALFVFESLCALEHALRVMKHRR